MTALSTCITFPRVLMSAFHHPRRDPLEQEQTYGLCSNEQNSILDYAPIIWWIWQTEFIRGAHFVYVLLAMSKTTAELKGKLIIKEKGIGVCYVFTNATPIFIVSTLISLQIRRLMRLWFVVSSMRRMGWQLVGASVPSFLLFLQDVGHLMKALSTATAGASG